MKLAAILLEKTGPTGLIWKFIRLLLHKCIYDMVLCERHSILRLYLQIITIWDVKDVFHWSSLITRIFQKLQIESTFVIIFMYPRLLRYYLIRGSLYISSTVAAITIRYSTQNRNQTSLFWTKTTGLSNYRVNSSLTSEVIIFYMFLYVTYLILMPYP